MVNGQACQHETSTGQVCGRPIHPTTNQHIASDRCVLHLQDRSKPQAPFKTEFATIQPDMGILDYSGILFPTGWDFSSHTFDEAVDFGQATFYGSANFSRAKFRRYANFSGSVFVGEALFGDAVFQENANFYSAHFQSHSSFLKSIFNGVASFSNLRSGGRLHFNRAFFSDSVYFSGSAVNGLFFERATFLGAENELDFSVKETSESPLDFRGARVEGKFTAENVHLSDVDLRGATFGGKVRFFRTVFEGDLRLVSTTFKGTADFRFCRFEGPVVATGARFISDARFFHATFNDRAVFQEVSFGGQRSPNGGTGVADFRRVSFADPARVRFVLINDKEELGVRYRLHNTDLRGLHFDSVNWHRSQRRWYRAGRLTLQDELDVRATLRGAARQPGLTPETAVTIYQELLKNLEEKREFALAEDCFCGAMDLRFMDMTKPRLERLFILGYRGASYYGSSYVQALVILLALLIGFGVIFCAVGLAPASPTLNLTPAPHEALASIGNGLFHAFQVATFQETAFLPTRVAAKLLEGLLRVLVAGQVALFLLALRRRFRR